MKILLKLFALAFLASALTLTTGCKKDDDGPDRITDADGNVYNSVTLGTQVWLKENLKTTKYRNGTNIETTNPPTLDISGESSPKYQWAYEGNENLVATYGRLYTWYAVTDSNHVCPKGWHVPSDVEWTILENYLIDNGYNYDNTTTDNKIAKALASDVGWNFSSNTGAVGNPDYPGKRNATSFTALPAGRRGIENPPVFGYMGSDTRWWTSSQSSPENAWTRHIAYGDSSLIRASRSKLYGLPVRCIKD